MIAEVSKRLINVEEYYKMAEVGILKPSDRVELIYGEIIEMSPIGSRHASVVDKLANRLNNFFDKEIIVGVQRPIRLDDKNEPEPDISILKFRSDFYAGLHPQAKDALVLIEVSDSTLKFDEKVKLSLYASSGIPCYWIVNVDANHIVVYTKPKGLDYLEKRIYQFDDSIELLGKRVFVQEVITQPNG